MNSVHWKRMNRMWNETKISKQRKLKMCAIFYSLFSFVFSFFQSNNRPFSSLPLKSFFILTQCVGPNLPARVELRKEIWQIQSWKKYMYVCSSNWYDIGELEQDFELSKERVESKNSDWNKCANIQLGSLHHIMHLYSKKRSSFSLWLLINIICQFVLWLFSIFQIVGELSI